MGVCYITPASILTTLITSIQSVYIWACAVMAHMWRTDDTSMS